MIFSLVNFLRGYLVIEVCGVFIERFINLAIKNNIFLWSVEKKEKNRATMKISVRGFFYLREAARKTRVRVKIIKRCGLPMFLHKHRRRKAFYIGFLIFAAIILFLTSFIWSVEIEGNEKTDEKIIRDALSTCGIRAGVVKYGHSSHAIQEQMMIKVPALSWFWVEIKGTRAVVTVKERVEKPEIADKNTPCNIVAKCDGVIENMIVINGNQVAAPGDVVKKGDLLVSGVYDTKYSGVRLLSSRGQVFATTWHTRKETFPLERKISEKTGNTKNKTVLNIFGKEVPLFPIGGIKFETYEEEVYEKQLRLWGDLYLPLIIKTSVAEETSESIKKMNEAEALSFYREEMIREMERELSAECEIIKREIEHEIKDGKIFISVVLTCREDIAELREIQVGG